MKDFTLSIFSGCYIYSGVQLCEFNDSHHSFNMHIICLVDIESRLWNRFLICMSLMKTVHQSICLFIAIRQAPLPMLSSKPGLDCKLLFTPKCLLKPIQMIKKSLLVLLVKNTQDHYLFIAHK